LGDRYDSQTFGREEKITGWIIPENLKEVFGYTDSSDWRDFAG
jgi:hypothetical protein